MEFGVKKFAMLKRGGKRQITEIIEQPNEEKIRTLGKRKLTYLGILKTDTIKQVKMKEKSFKKYKDNEKTTQNQTLLQEPHKRNKKPERSPLKDTPDHS